jgi:protein SCO1
MHLRVRGLLVVAVVVLGVAAAALALASPRGGSSPAPKALPKIGFHGAKIPRGTAAPDFRLRSDRSSFLRLSDERGKLVLLTFLFTKCTDVCPVVAAQLDSVVRGLGRRADSVAILAISVDPEGDTLSAVRAYRKSHHLGPQFRWLIGSRQQLWPVWHEYNVAVARAQDSDTIAHTAPVLLLDRQGRPRVYFQQPHSPRVIAHDVRLLLRTASR